MSIVSGKVILAFLASFWLCDRVAANDIYDVIIIGAGWSGLAAANHLIETGITENILILEARDRIGGRSYTIEDAFEPGHPVELGSAWVYPGTNVFDLVEKVGISHDSTDYVFDTLGLYNSTGELSEDEKSILICQDFKEDFYEHANRNSGSEVDWMDIKESYFAENPFMTNLKRQSINALVHSAITIEFGSPLNDTNSETTKDYLVYDFSGIEFMAVPGGTGGGYTGALTRGLAQNFAEKIKMNEPVVTVDQQGDIIKAYTSNDRVFYARSAIVTVPLGVLKSSSIEFVPPLSDEKLEAIDLIGMGNMNKVIMYWSTFTQDVSWWPQGKTEMQLITDDDSTSDEWTYFYIDESHYGNKNYHVLTSWCGGDACDRLELLSDQETIDLVLRNLRMMLGNNVPPPSERIITRWRSDEFSGGAYSYDAGGIESSRYRKTLSEPMGNVFFAGEATVSNGWQGTAVAAYTSGVEAARSVEDSGVLEQLAPQFLPQWDLHEYVRAYTTDYSYDP
ncbi:unnamed protein product [Pseudo-nitzschia multistriata]|uniref:Amine oxidase n=1 Tax=Pseudo-nitzschia multistriata TaxID=183589 RepID=A0A448ZG72_9STRA|nr:unnamed protein product [Pseudo-nitzschia multistriata]